MNSRWIFFILALALAATTSQAADGLTVPRADALWPNWQARIYLQTSTSRSLAAGTVQELRGGAVLGDYFLARPSFGVFRATSGIVAGSLSGAPLYKALPSQQLGLYVQSSGLFPSLFPSLPPSLLSVADSPQPLPYLGLGFSTPATGTGLSISADFGLVAQNPGQGLGLGRAMLGNQGVERAFRELRLSPMAQLSVRYAY